jgi:hypothetical protein
MKGASTVIQRPDAWYRCELHIELVVGNERRAEHHIYP